jgi:hypothetical protein
MIRIIFETRRDLFSGQETISHAQDTNSCKECWLCYQTKVTVQHADIKYRHFGHSNSSQWHLEQDLALEVLKLINHPVVSIVNPTTGKSDEGISQYNHGISQHKFVQIA